MYFPYSPEMIDAIDRATELLEQNNYAPGDKFLTAEALAAALNIPIELAGLTIEQMQNQGLIESEENGYYVAKAKYIRNMWSMSSLTEAAAARKQKISSRVVIFEIMEAPKFVSLALSLSLGTHVYRLLRIRTTGGRSVLEDSYLPVSMFPELLSYNFGAESLYKVLENDYNTKAVNQSLEFLIEMPNENEAKLLGISKDEPMLVVSGPTGNQNGNVFEYSIAKSSGVYTRCEAKPLIKEIL